MLIDMALAPRKLKQSDIEKKLKKLPEWNVNAKYAEISRTFPLRSFITGLSFIAKIAVHAELMNHHPEIELSYGGVKVRISTHDVKGLTNLDFELAKKIDTLKVS